MRVALHSWHSGGGWLLLLLLALLWVAGCVEVGEAPSPTVASTPTPTALVTPAVAEVTPQRPEGVAATGETWPGEAADGEESAAPLPAPPAGATPATADRPREKRIIALDPGHGGPETGAWANGLAEKDLNLDIALRLADLLRAEGFEVVLTRDSDRAVSPLYTGGGYAGGLRYDMQARVDIANAAGADLFISIHNNGSTDPSQSGTEVWYNVQREFSDRNLVLARLVQENLVKRIRELGYPVVDRGIKEDTAFRIYRGQPYNLYVLGPGTGPRPHEPTHMPGVLGESLILTNPGDAAMLSQESTLDAIAAGYRDAVVAYFEVYPD